MMTEPMRRKERDQSAFVLGVVVGIAIGLVVALIISAYS
jgi:hypothetical protein